MPHVHRELAFISFSEAIMRSHHPSRASAFTLVELLVVIAVVAVLIAILLPSMARAKYRAILIQCLAKERMLGVAVLNYTEQNRSWYPYRTTGMNGQMPHVIRDSFHVPATDDRPMFKKFMDIDQQLICPFAPLRAGKSLSDTSANVFSTYELRFGTRIIDNQEQSKMLRVGDRARYTTGGVTYRFNVLAADYERDWNNSSGASYHVQTGHPDEGSATPRFEIYDATYILSYHTRFFASSAARTRPPLERNFLFDDGSAKTIKSRFYDPAFVVVPAYSSSSMLFNNISMFLPPMD